MNTHDQAAFETFCADLVDEGFSPVADSGGRVWTGPIRPSLHALFERETMLIDFRDGWPLRYAHVTVPGARGEHIAEGLLCLWAEDDPAQIAGKKLSALWARIEEWALAAGAGFGGADQALDAFMYYRPQSPYLAELPLDELVASAENGYRAELIAKRHGLALLIEAPGPGGADISSGTGDGEPGKLLKGALYVRNDIGVPPRDFDEFRRRLTRRQSEHLSRGLADRAPAGVVEVSTGLDFAVLTWPRHGKLLDALVIAFASDAETVEAHAMSTAPTDMEARRRRAGPDAPDLASKRVLIAGVGSIGGQIALGLANSGVGELTLRDSDFIRTANVVRHVCSDIYVGHKKTWALNLVIGRHAPWCAVTEGENLTEDPVELVREVAGYDLVIDATGTFSITAALSEICHRTRTPLVDVALFHQGAIARVRRQATGDTPIALRRNNDRYHQLPPEPQVDFGGSFLELGCTAPVNNAPPAAGLTAAAEALHLAIDYLTGRAERPDEQITVLRRLAEAPFDRLGSLEPRNRLPPATTSPPDTGRRVVAS